MTKQPSNRLPPQVYIQVRDHLLNTDADAREIYAWSRTGRKPPETPEHLAGEIIWIILCAGRSAQAARTIERRVRAALDAGESAATAFGYRAKAAAIDRAWRERTLDFQKLHAVLKADNPALLLDWCESIPFVGAITKYQLAKNLGRDDVTKPDIHLCRLAGIADDAKVSASARFAVCMQFCAPLAAASGDTIATVDSILWLGANKGVFVVDAAAGPISFNPTGNNRGSIYLSPTPA
jgi:hypothetical protein